jgi:hypothetical protein
MNRSKLRINVDNSARIFHMKFYWTDTYDFILHVKSSSIISPSKGGISSLFSTEHLLVGSLLLIILLSH